MHTAKTVSIAVVLLTLIAAFASPDHLLTACVGGVLAAGIRLLWPETDAPVLLLPFGLQWLCVAMKPLETALTGQPLDNFGDFGEPLSTAAWFALAGVTVLGLGMWLGSRRRVKVDWAATLARDASQWPAATIVQISIFLILLGNGLALLAPHAGPANQILVGFQGTRNAGLFILAYWCLREGKALGILAVVVAVEVVFGMTGFFAGFRETFLVLVIAVAAARPKVGISGLLAGGLLFAMMLVVGVFWSSIKTDYRAFLNQGTQQQVVTQPLAQRLSYVGQAVDEFNASQFNTGLRELAARISYIDFLACTIGHVPSALPFEHGGRLGAAVLNIIEPRILFPDKPPTPDDSAVTAHYTGLDLNTSGGTSISIGYLGELYIDFNFIGGLIGTFIIGLAAGWAYGFIRSYRGIPLIFTYGVACMAEMLFSIFETDLVRFLGSAITAILACLILQRVIAPQVLLALANRAASGMIADRS